MSLNFKLLRRSFSLRNNVPEDKEDKNVTNSFKASTPSKIVSFFL